MSRRNLPFFTLLFVCATLSTAAYAETVIIHAGTLLAVPGEPPVREKTILVIDDRVERVLDGYRDAAELRADDVIDLRQSFVMPGLMDMHVHLQNELSPEVTSRDLRWSDELVQMFGYRNAMKILMAGFTTVRDLGSRTQQTYAVRYQ